MPVQSNKTVNDKHPSHESARISFNSFFSAVSSLCFGTRAIDTNLKYIFNQPRLSPLATTMREKKTLKRVANGNWNVKWKWLDCGSFWDQLKELVNQRAYNASKKLRKLPWKLRKLPWKFIKASQILQKITSLNFLTNF